MEPDHNNSEESEDLYDEEETAEDMAIDNEARIDALAELLIKKGVITQEEYDDCYEKQYDDLDEEEVEEIDEESGDELTE